MRSTNNGWIKLYRQIIDSAVFDYPKLLKVWIWCLCKASHKEHEMLIGNQVVRLEPGQFVFGRHAASVELKMPEGSIPRYINALKNNGNLTTKSNNKYTIITVENWASFQVRDDDTEQQMNNKRTTNEQQMNTNKNVKNVNNVKKIGKSAPKRKLKCPSCGGWLIEKELNGSLCWCHSDGWKTDAKCSMIFNSVEEIQKLKKSQEQIPELTAQQKKNLEKLEKLMAGIGGKR